MRTVRFLLVGVALVALAAGAYTTIVWLRGFQPVQVVEGRVYRSRQPSGVELRAATARLGLASVLNLRGARPGEPWYDEELEASRELGLARQDVKFQVVEWPPREEVHALVRFLENAPTPLLMHCRGGVDRSGWAAAIVRLLAGDALAEARDELTLAPWTLIDGKRNYLRWFFDRYELWLAETRRTHDVATFREWVLEVYCPPIYNAEIVVLQQPPRHSVPPGSRLHLSLAVTNRSEERWTMSSAQKRGIRLGAALLGPFVQPPPDILSEFRRPGPRANDLGRAGMEEGTIDPGESRVFEFTFTAPLQTGLYVIHFDMVDEMVHWFSDVGTPGVLVDLQVDGPATP